MNHQYMSVTSETTHITREVLTYLKEFTQLGFGKVGNGSLRHTQPSIEW